MFLRVSAASNAFRGIETVDFTHVMEKYIVSLFLLWPSNAIIWLPLEWLTDLALNL